MKNQLELTRTFYPEQLYIELSEQQMINAWNQAEKHNNDIIRWRAYLNYLVVEAIPQIKSELGLEEKLGYYPSDLSKVLEFINGTILTLGETRLVVIPSDSNIGGDLCVPQELVDLPQFAGDYYLGVYINLDEEWLRFWGACSHKKLTTEGVYDESSRNYYLDRDELIEDLEAVLIAREICPNERGEYKFVNLPRLSESEANVLLEQLKQPDCYVARLKFDSPTWLSLFVNDLAVNKLWNNLTEWVLGVFSNGWQPEERALLLGINRGIQPNEQPEVKWEKVIRLGMQMPQETVVLILRQKQLNETEIEVNLRLYPSADAMYLPDGVKLEVLDENGTPIPTLEAQAKGADNWIKLNKFTAEKGDKFCVKVSLEESSIIEHFLI